MILWVMIYMSSCAVGYSRSAGRAMIFVLRRRSRPDKPRVTALGANDSSRSAAHPLVPFFL